MDFIKDTLYTQTMYAEFERDVHNMLENNENVNINESDLITFYNYEEE